ncbi:MAG: SGNH/GDSL hydrolase family protein [Ruminococcus callidus]|nr:SGNH/GDSL hydrolase family protein [Ruminococcus callidus]
MMTHKLFACAAAAVLLLGCMTGCSSDRQSSQDAIQNATDSTISGAYADIIERSLLSLGNTTRIRAAMDRAQNGNATIGFIGGSITEGMTAGGSDCYATCTYRYFQEHFAGNNQVQYVNAGLSGTSSVLGLLRTQKELFQYAPDVIFIEFAVNDAQDEEHRIAYESLVKSCLNQPQQPAVVLVFTMLKDGYSCQEQMTKIGEAYQLPMISVGDALNPEFQLGRMQWSEYSDDSSHPNKFGHQLVASMISNYLEKAAVQPPAEESLPQTPVYGDGYMGATLVDLSGVTSLGSFEPRSFSQLFDRGYAAKADGTAQPLSFTVTGKKLFLVYTAQNSADWGIAGVYVNDRLVSTVSANSKNGWGGPAVVLAYESDTPQEMHVQLSMLQEQESKQFQLLGVGIQ